MSTFSDQTNPYDSKPPQQTQQKNWVPTCLIGCLVMFVLMLALGGWGVWVMVQNFKQIGADFARNIIVETIRESELSEKDQQAVIAQVDRVVGEFKAGNIAMEDVGRVLEELGESPLIGQAMIFYAEETYVQPSGLSDEEKADAKRIMQRVARGVVEESIDPEQLEGPMQHISETSPDGERQMKEKVTDEELRAFLAACKQLADDAGVPDEPFEVNIGEEVKKAVDRALGAG